MSLTQGKGGGRGVNHRSLARGRHPELGPQGPNLPRVLHTGQLAAHRSVLSKTHTALVFLSPVPTGQGPLGGGIRCPRASSWNTTRSGKACLRLCLALKTTLFSTMGENSNCNTLVSRVHCLPGKKQPRPWKQGGPGRKSCQRAPPPPSSCGGQPQALS